MNPKLHLLSNIVKGFGRLILFILVFFLASEIYSQQKYILVIRVDDILSRNTVILPRSIKPFEQAVESRGGKVTWLVIPNRLIESTNNDGSLTRELRETITRGHEVAQHGFIHICKKCNSSGHEMWCATYSSPFTYSEQLKLVSDGTKIIQDSIGVIPLTFVSPGHHEDSTTYDVIASLGFKWISTSKPTKSFLSRNLFNLAHHQEFTWALTSSFYHSKLNSAIQDIKSKFMSEGYYCLLFHDYFIRSGYEDSIVVRWTGALLDSLNNLFGSQIEFMTVSAAAKHFKDALTSTESGIVQKISSFRLYQNFPNPFNPSTVISYQLSAVSYVTLKVYDILGKEIETLVDEVLEPGIHHSTFHIPHSAFTSGVYFYQLRAGSYVETKKMILQK